MCSKWDMETYEIPVYHQCTREIPEFDPAGSAHICRQPRVRQFIKSVGIRDDGMKGIMASCDEVSANSVPNRPGAPKPINPPPPPEQPAVAFHSSLFWSHTTGGKWPALLTSGDVLDISRKNTFSIHFSAAGIPSGRGVLLQYGRRKDGHIPFPAHSRGFLYYHRKPHAAPLEGSLRFRVTPDDNPSSFPHGQDLLTPWGFPWELILPQIARRGLYSKIQDQLLHENLATEEQFSHCRTLFHSVATIDPQYTLFRLDSTFPLNFSSTMRLTAVGDALYSLKLSPHAERIWRPFNNDWTDSPWSGSALVHFEPSTRPEHTGRRMVHLRIEKIIQPVACIVEGYKGRVLKPEEGELLTVSIYRRTPEPWAYDIDRDTIKNTAGFRALWDKTGSH
ncbi:hypothetical protein C8R44DRAFT_856871 [Mycena epipterygia]|nr:hypothetical protein C8R44DRAFT_856871 [Mycena epipterygia]